MKLSELYKRLPDESSCQNLLKRSREKNGVFCKKCGGENHYWKEDKKSFECKSCRFRTSLKNGTIMENSNLPYKYWVSVIYYLHEVNWKVSALEVQKELGHKRYEPIWLMLKKIKSTAKNESYIFMLSNCLENKESKRFFKKEVSNIELRDKFQRDENL